MQYRIFRALALSVAIVLSFTVQVYGGTVCQLISISSSVAYASLTPTGAGASSLYTINLLTGTATLVGAIGSGSTVGDIAYRADGVIFAVSSSGTSLFTFKYKTPSTTTAPLTITGLQPGEQILGIDFRPADGTLYGLGSTSRLYTINTATGAATQVGTGTFLTPLTGAAFGFDFNPTVDRIRVVSNAGQNFRLNPADGTQTLDTLLNGAATSAVAAAYINNYAGASLTTLYDIDAVTDGLYTQNPPNNGTLNFVGNLGLDTNTLVGFDITNPHTLPDVPAGQPYSQTLTASGGTGPYTFTIASGSLPPNLLLSSSGTISGTATGGGSFPFTITATDINGCTGSQSYTITATCPAILVSPSTLPNGTVGVPYTQSLNASGGTGPYTFNLTAGTLPDGVSLNSSTGSISGTPTTTAPYSFTIKATDANGCSGSTSYAVTIVCPTLGVSSSIAYASLTSPGGFWSTLFKVDLTSGAATSVDSIGAVVRSISVAPPGDFLFAVDDGGTTLLSFPPNQPSVITSSVPITGLQPGEQILAIDFRPANAALYGLGSSSRLYTINATTGVATIVGSGFTPALSGTAFGFAFNPVVDRIRVVSNTGQNLRLNPLTGSTAAVDTPLNGAATHAVGAAYTNSYAGATATTLYDIDAVSDSLYIQNPPNNGTLGLVGGLGFDTSDFVGFDISNPHVLPAAHFNNSYSQPLTGVLGTPPYSFSVGGGSLPPGLFLASNGIVSGTPTSIGSFTFTVNVSDVNGCTGSQSVTLNVVCPTIVVVPPILSAGSLGTPYSEAVAATGGDGPYSFAISGGSLPNNISLDSVTGAVTGTPTVQGTFNFTVLATDANGCTGSKSYTVKIGCASSISPTFVTVPAAGSSSTFNVNTSSPCSWTAVASGGFITTSSTGTGNGTVSYTVAQHTLTSTRYGMISVGGKDFFVTQSGVVPTNLVATAVSPTSISITWSSTPVDRFVIWRYASSGSGFQFLATAYTTSYTDTVPVNSAFIYKVQAVDIYSSASPDSNSDLAMTFTFLDDPIVPNVTPIKGAQIVQMRNAVNIVRGIAGIGDYPFSDGALGAVKVKLLHLTQLETALNEARTSLGLTAVSYPSRTIGSKVGAAEFTLLRNGMK